MKDSPLPPVLSTPNLALTNLCKAFYHIHILSSREMFSNVADFASLLCMRKLYRPYIFEFRGGVPKISGIMILNKRSAINAQLTIAAALELRYPYIDSAIDDIIKTAG